MRLLTAAEAAEWRGGRDMQAGPHAGAHVRNDEAYRLRFALPQDVSRQYATVRFLEHCVRPWSECVLWVMEWGIWPSSENWHFFGLFRSSYGFDEALAVAPAHVFGEDECCSLLTLAQVCLANGWGFALVTDSDAARAVISHDEFVQFYGASPAKLAEIRSGAAEFGLRPWAGFSQTTKVHEHGPS